MKAFEINQNDSGQRLDRFVKKAAPLLPPSLIQRYIRLKRIKVNGKRGENGLMLALGDRVEMYVNDEFFLPEQALSLPFLAAGRELNIVYEDEHLLLVDKRPGMVVHEDDDNEQDNLINRIKRYLYEGNKYNPADENSFVPALCNRIDRNTGGIVIAAKDAATLRVMNHLIRERLIKKYYLCIAHGRLTPHEGRLKGYIKKDNDNNKVQVFDSPVAEARTAITQYKTLESNEHYSLLEVELFTGRTHQIRAQLAHARHPLLGDGKYGLAKDNKQSGYKFQALYSYRLILEGGDASEHLTYLNGKLFEVEKVWFADDFRANKIV